MQRGFTLIELVVVIAIIAIVAALAIPQLGDWRAQQDLDAAAREMAADIRLLQQITINSGGVSPIMSFKTTAPYGYITSLNLTAIQPSRDFPATIILSSADPKTLTFGLSGAPMTAKTITLTRTDGKGQKQIIIDRVGRVRIE